MDNHVRYSDWFLAFNNKLQFTIFPIDHYNQPAMGAVCPDNAHILQPLTLYPDPPPSDMNVQFVYTMMLFLSHFLNINNIFS